MSRPPHYAPRSRYRTRQSGSEVEAIDDNAATAIDRVVPDLEQLERQYGKPPSETQTPAAQIAPKGPSAALVVALALALAVAFVVIAALGGAVFYLLTR